MKYDICVVSIPYIPYNLPPAAPALLKGHLNTKGFTATARELNLEFKNRLNNDSMLYELIPYWYEGTTKLSEQTKETYFNLLDELSIELTNIDTRWIGLSVFSPHSMIFCRDLLTYIKKHNSNGIKIVIGGMSVTSYYASTISEYIDAYILGEGELPLENLLLGNFDHPGINSPGNQIDDLDQIGFSDYSDYNLQDYDTFYKNLTVQITASRGCIRNCTFCNVASKWPKYRYRSGDLVADEIISTYETTGTKDFFFTDSLINGNLKELMIMMQKLADYKEKNNAEITWGGQWISRKQKGLPANYYDLIQRSGGFNLTIGVETGSDKVREDMKKGFTNEDLAVELEFFSKHGITCSFFILVGYITETEKDFIDTLDMLKTHLKYVADGTIVGVILGSGYLPLEGTPDRKNENITWQAYDDTKFKWKSLVSNAGFMENIRRRIIAQMVVDNLKWPTNNTIYELGPTLTKIKEMESEELDIYRDNLIEINKEFVNSNYRLVKASELKIEIALTGYQGMDYPQVEILCNNKVLALATVEGSQSYTVICPARYRNSLKIRLTNKTQEDTIIDSNGAIVKQKYLSIDEIKINDIRMRKDYIYLKGNVKLVDGEKIKANNLYDNGTYHFYFTNPIEEFFINQKEFYYNINANINKSFVNDLIGFYNQLISHT